MRRLELSGWDELKIAGKKYVETIKDLTNNIVDGNFDDAIDNAKTLVATNALVAEKVVSGVLKIGEYVNDGLTMLKATGASIYTLGVDAIFGTNYTDELWDATMDYVAIDQIGNMEKFYYEKTKLGQFNNDNSLLKYDSKGAETIKSVSTKVGEVTIATVITVATGGTAAPVVAAGVGFLEGTGQGGEKYFSMTDEDGNYTNRDIKSIGLSYLDGVQKGAEWYISGQVGSSVVKGFNSYLNPATVTQEVIGQATGNTFKDAVINTVKLPDMYVDFAAATAKAGAGYITNGEIDWQSYALEMGFAVLGNFAGELLSAASANKLLKEQNGLADGKIALEDINEQITKANIVAKETGEVSQIRINSIEDLTDKQLEAIGDKQLVSFVVDGKKEPISFEDAFIELKRSGKIPADSPLMKEYNSKIETDISQAQEAIRKNITPKVIKIDSINDLTLEQVLKIEYGKTMRFQVKEFDNRLLTYEQIYNSLKSKGSMLADVTRTAKGRTDIISKTRSVYYELGKKVHYNVEVIDDNSIMNKMLSKMTTFDTLNPDNKIVCRGWSELYKEALIESGVSVDNIKIINVNDKHWWVEVYDPKYNCFIVADATEAARTNGLMNFDLSSVKNGMPTKGFYVLSAEKYNLIKEKNGCFGTRVNKLANDLELVSNNDAYLRKLDISLGYASKQGYKAELVEKANKLFSNNSLLEKVSKSDPNAIKRNIFLKVPLNENVDGYEAYGYFKKIFGKEAEISYEYSKKYDTIISIKFPNDPNVMVYSKELGRKIMGEAEYRELINQI